MNEMTQKIKILRAPEIQFTPIPAVCNNSSQISIKPYASVPGFTGSFLYSGNGVSPAGVFDPKMITEITNPVFYSFTATNGCVDSSSNSISIIPAPKVDAGPGLYLLKGESGRLQASASGTGLSYSWYPSLYLDNDHILQPTSTPFDDIDYTLTVTGTGDAKTVHKYL